MSTLFFHISSTSSPKDPTSKRLLIKKQNNEHLQRTGHLPLPHTHTHQFTCSMPCYIGWRDNIWKPQSLSRWLLVNKDSPEIAICKCYLQCAFLFYVWRLGTCKPKKEGDVAAVKSWHRPVCLRWNVTSGSVPIGLYRLGWSLSRSYREHQTFSKPAVPWAFHRLLLLKDLRLNFPERYKVSEQILPKLEEKETVEP